MSDFDSKEDIVHPLGFALRDAEKSLGECAIFLIVEVAANQRFRKPCRRDDIDVFRTREWHFE